MPYVGSYEIYPCILELKDKSAEELRRIKNFTIENIYGRIKFKEPISVYKKSIPNCVDISQDSIEIIDYEWDNSACEMTFKDFGNYTDQSTEKRRIIEKKMRQWLIKNNM